MARHLQRALVEGQNLERQMDSTENYSGPSQVPVELEIIVDHDRYSNFSMCNTAVLLRDSLVCRHADEHLRFCVCLYRGTEIELFAFDGKVQRAGANETVLAVQSDMNQWHNLVDVHISTEQS